MSNLNNITKMKKSLTQTVIMLTAAAVVMSAGSSCEKDNGVYSPKKKISKVYREASYRDTDNPSVAVVQDKYLYENWIWSDGLVQQIDHYEDPNSVWTEVFTYDDNGRVVKIQDVLWSEMLTFEYEDGRISKTRFFSDGVLFEECDFTYENGRLVSMVGRDYYYKSKSHLSPLGSLGIDGAMNDALTKAIGKCKSASKGTYEFKIHLDWTKDNITVVTVSSDYYATTFRLEYDQNKNPKRGLIDLYMDNVIIGAYSSANNITKYTETVFGMTEAVEFGYEYEGKYPVTKQWTVTDEDGSEQYTEYYVYE